MLRMGRTNQRQLEGPIRLARGTRELLDTIEELYKAWFLVWRDTVVPKIMFQPKWYDSSKDLEEGDLVYFQKKEGKLDTPWTIGMVEQVVRSERDQTIRKIVVKYQNPGENFPRLTDRSIRTLVKLFNVDEFQVQDDLTELQKKIDKIRNNDVNDVVQEETVQNDENNEDVVHTSENSEVDEQDGMRALAIAQLLTCLMFRIARMMSTRMMQTKEESCMETIPNMERNKVDLLQIQEVEDSVYVVVNHTAT